MAQVLQRHAVEPAFTLIVAVQPDPAAPFVPVADYNIIADPAEFAGALLEVLVQRRGIPHFTQRAQSRNGNGRTLRPFAAVGV